MRSFCKIWLKVNLVSAILLVSSIPQKTLAIELIPILDKVGKHAVEGAIKGFFGIDDDILDDDYDEYDEYYDDYDDYDEYDEYDEYDNSDEYDEYVEIDYEERASQNYRSRYRYAPYPPVAPPPEYGYYPGYPHPGYMMPPPSYPSYPVYAPGYPAYSPPPYTPGYSESYFPNASEPTNINW